MIFHLSRTRPPTTELLSYDVERRIRRTPSRPPNRRKERRARKKH